MQKNGTLIGSIEEDNSKIGYTHVIYYRCSECGYSADAFYVNLGELKKIKNFNLDRYIEEHKPISWNINKTIPIIQCNNCFTYLYNKIKVI